MNKGNRPDDVCALCDRPIDRVRNPLGHASLQCYLGPGWVHGGGREYIAIHYACAWLATCPEDAPIRPDLVRAVFGTAEAKP